MNSEPEFTAVESPFIDKFISIGWSLVAGNLDHPSVTGREAFRKGLSKSELRKAIECIELCDGEWWLVGTSIAQAFSALEVAEVQKPRGMHCGLVEKILGCRVPVIGMLAESAT
jgi:hypothetical protein